MYEIISMFSIVNGFFLCIIRSKELSSKKALLATNLRNLQHVLRTKREDGECISYICTYLHSYACYDVMS